MNTKVLGLVTCIALLVVSQASATTVIFSGGTLDTTGVLYTESGMEVRNVASPNVSTHLTANGLFNGGGDWFTFVLADHNNFKLDQLEFSGNADTEIFGYSLTTNQPSAFKVGGGSVVYDLTAVSGWSNTFLSSVGVEIAFRVLIPAI